MDKVESPDSERRTINEQGRQRHYRRVVLPADARHNHDTCTHFSPSCGLQFDASREPMHTERTRTADSPEYNPATVDVVCAANQLQE